MRPPFLAFALPFIAEMSQLVELHVLLELSPDGWRSNILDIAPLDYSGIRPAAPILEPYFPPEIAKYWEKAASFSAVVHNCQKSLHPRTWALSRVAASHIRRIQPDLVHLDDLSLRTASMIPWLGGIPLVLSIHDPEAHTGESSWRSRLARMLVFSRVRRFILRSTSQRQSFCTRYHLSEETVDAIPLGVELASRAWAAPATGSSRESNPPCVLFFGRLSPYKGIDVLFQAASLVAREFAGVNFVVAGRAIPGYQLPSPPDLAGRGTFQILDTYISNLGLAQLLEHATLVVCPYTDATQSGVILTAYAFGKPVVASRVGGIPEYVEDNVSGLLVPPNDPVALAAAIVRLLSNSSLQEELRVGIGSLVKGRLSWKRIAEETTLSYERAIAK